MTTDKKTNDDLLERLGRLEAQTDSAQKAARSADTDAIQDAAIVFRGTRKLMEFFNRAAGVAKTIWDHSGGPVWNVIKPSATWAWDKYNRNVWQPFAYKENDHGELEFSAKKAAVTLVASFMIAAMALPAAVGAAKLGYDAVRMGTTMRSEVVYLHTPEQIAPDIFRLRGCETQVQCAADDIVIYDVEASPMNHIWSLWNNGSLYVSDSLAGVVAPGAMNECTVTIYGAKHEDFYRNLGIYPELLDISCEQVQLDSAAIQNGTVFSTPEAVIQAEFLRTQGAPAPQLMPG